MRSFCQTVRLAHDTTNFLEFFGRYEYKVDILTNDLTVYLLKNIENTFIFFL